MSNENIVIVHGPRRCGKSWYGQRLLKRFNCSRLVDEWDGCEPLADGDLALTNLTPPFHAPGAKVVDFESARRDLQKTFKATVSIAEEHEILIQDAGIFAIRQRGQIEVWSADGETHIGNLPEDATEAQIRAAAKFWGLGFATGVSFGRDEAQAKLRTALGLRS